jgi:hypothetical protein
MFLTEPIEGVEIESKKEIVILQKRTSIPPLPPPRHPILDPLSAIFD